MGITNFYKWIKSDYNNCIKNINNQCYNHVYIDINYLLHLCYHNSNDLNHMMNKMATIILDICIKTQPSDTLNLYCDGTSPFAKLLLQRERRFNMTDDSGLNSGLNSDLNSSLNFTPGTIFIKSIPEKLNKILNIIKNQFNIEVNIDVIEPGESEIKIKNKLLQNYYNNKNKSHILVTNDADVILILTSHESYKKCNILLHNDVLSIEQLINEHNKKFGISEFPHLDFSFLNLFVGNDYLPKLAFASIESLWNAYKFNINLLSTDKYLIKFNEYNEIIINYDLLFDIFNTIINKMSKVKLKKYNDIYHSEIYQNYFDGLIWNMKMYNTGCCNDYYYFCLMKKPIDIINLILFLSDKKPQIINYNIINKPISSELCSILILPESGRNLIDNKYHKFIDKLNKKINIYDKNFKITKENISFIIDKFNKFT
jgi:hypothetical protein